MASHSHAAPDLRCETITNVAAIAALRDELARLAESAGAASGIVQHPDWLLCELEMRGAAAVPCLVVARDKSARVVAYAPLLAEPHVARVAFGHRSIALYRGPALRLLGAWVVSAPERRVDAERAIAVAIAADPQIRVVRIQETTLPSTFATALTASRTGFTCVASNLLEQVNWMIQPKESLEAWLADLGSKRRNDLTRRLRNVYKKLGAQAQLRVFEAPEQVDDYCRLMNHVYSRSWHADELAIDWELPARRALLRRLGAGGFFVGHLLLLGDRPIAYVHGYRLDGRYLLDDTGYDEEFANLGVGSALVFQAVQDLLERHPNETIDFGYGDNQYKRILANHQVPCGSLYFVRGATRLVRFQLIGPLRRLYRWLRCISKARTT